MASFHRSHPGAPGAGMYPPAAPADAAAFCSVVGGGLTGVVLLVRRGDLNRA